MLAWGWRQGRIDLRRTPGSLDGKFFVECGDSFMGEQISKLKKLFSVCAVHYVPITYTSKVVKVKKRGICTPFGEPVFLIGDPCV